MVYTGRFAPSPTGPLHFGSLLAALASYLDARAHNGRWLLRIEDLDPPREVAGATNSILKSLEQFGLTWDGEVIRQSHRHAIYNDILAQLTRRGATYRCSCSRQTLLKRSGGTFYDSYCRNHPLANDAPCAIRVRCEQDYPFDDRIQGAQQFSHRTEDFTLFRRDGLFAYQLAVTIDDAQQQITHIVRGSDLLDSTPKQIHLQRLLGYHQPIYAHIPVATNTRGQKLSKQNFAPALDDNQARQLIIRALKFLGQQPLAELADGSVEECLSWATQHWDITAIPKTTGFILEEC